MNSVEVIHTHREVFYSTKREKLRFVKYLRKDGTIREGRFFWRLKVEPCDKLQGRRARAEFYTLLIAPESRVADRKCTQRFKKIFEHELEHQANFLRLKKELTQLLAASCWMSHEQFKVRLSAALRFAADRDTLLDLVTEHGKKHSPKRQ